MAARSRDFREFLFRATGKETSLKELSPIDVVDNLVAELERLDALAELLLCVKPEEAEGRTFPGIGALLKDIRARMEAVLRIGFDKTDATKTPR